MTVDVFCFFHEKGKEILAPDKCIVFNIIFVEILLFSTYNIKILIQKQTIVLQDINYHRRLMIYWPLKLSSHKIVEALQACLPLCAVPF